MDDARAGTPSPSAHLLIDGSRVFEGSVWADIMGDNLRLLALARRAFDEKSRLLAIAMPPMNTADGLTPQNMWNMYGYAAAAEKCWTLASWLPSCWRRRVPELTPASLRSPTASLITETRLKRLDACRKSVAVLVRCLSASTEQDMNVPTFDVSLLGLNPSDAVRRQIVDMVAEADVRLGVGRDAPSAIFVSHFV